MKKSIVLIISLVLAAACAIGGTVAYLTAFTADVKNTFTVGNIDIELKETKNDFKMVPGFDIAKDPAATVKGGSEKCYLIVKVDKSVNFDDYLTFTVADGWTKLEEGVYYRIVDASAEDQTFNILKDNKVTVKDTVTKDMMDTAKTAQPTLTFRAYACQYMKNNTTNFTAQEAWDQFLA